MDRFQNFSELERQAREGMDFMIEIRNGTSGFAIMAPHGGGIEPGTDNLADAIAGNDHFYYAFKGIRDKGNTRFHIASSRFDEPKAIGVARRCHTIITIHGCRDAAPVVYLGGKNDTLKRKIALELTNIAIPVNDAVRDGIKGLHPQNLCNRGKKGQGVQLEISSQIRRLFIGQAGWQHPTLTPHLQAFAQAVRKAL